MAIKKIKTNSTDPDQKPLCSFCSVSEIKAIHACIDLLLNVSLAGGQSLKVDKSLVQSACDLSPYIYISTVSL